MSQNTSTQSHVPVPIHWNDGVVGSVRILGSDILLIYDVRDIAEAIRYDPKDDSPSVAAYLEDETLLEEIPSTIQLSRMRSRWQQYLEEEREHA